MIRLGLIGDNIKPSRAPKLHKEAGRLCGVAITYDLLIPADMGMTFDGVFDKCCASGMHGLNITYPYKQIAVAKVEVEDPLVRRLGAINTVVFGSDGVRGYNTDHSGFIAAYRATFGSVEPGHTVIMGAGGAGSAVAFGLTALGCGELTIVDKDVAKAEALAQALGDIPVKVATRRNVDGGVLDVEGIVNCTPVGMAGHPGSPIDASFLGPQRWAFEAIYTPRQTEFIRAASAAGLKVMHGYELFIHQGVDAFRLFTGQSVDKTALRAALAE